MLLGVPPGVAPGAEPIPNHGQALLAPLRYPSEGRGPGSVTTSFAPVALAFDRFGGLFVLDATTDQICARDAEGRWFRFGVGDQGGGRFASLRGLEVRGPDLFALDPAESVLYRFGLDGRLRARIPLAAPEVGFVDAVDFAVDKAGELWVLDRAGGRLLRFGRDGSFLADLGRGGAGEDRLSSPSRLALGPDGGAWVLEPGRRRVRAFSRQGELRGGFSYEPAGNDASGTSQPDDGSGASVSPEDEAARGRAAQVVDLVAAEEGVVLVDAAGGIRAFAVDGTLQRSRSLGSEVGGITAAALSPEGILHLARPGAGEISRVPWPAQGDDGVFRKP